MSVYVPSMPSARARSKPALRARRADAGDPREVAIPGAVEHVEPLAAEPVERQPLRNPRREAEHAGDVRVRCDPDRDGAAHREPDEERRAGDEVERSTPVRHAGVERVPRLEPIAHSLSSSSMLPLWCDSEWRSCLTPISGTAGPLPSLPVLKVATRVMSVWNASTMMSYIVRRYSPRRSSETSRLSCACTAGSTFGRGVSSHLSARWVRTSTSRTEVRYCSSRPRSSLPSLLAQRLGFVENGIENAAAPLQAAPLFGDAALRFLEHVAKHDAGVALRGQADAVGTVRQRVSLVAQFDRREPRLRRGHLGHELIDRDRVPFRRADLAAGQPDGAAVVVMAQPVRVMQAADRRDDLAVLLQRRRAAWKLVVRAGLRHLSRCVLTPLGR